jgi:hypothetical protein
VCSGQGCSACYGTGVARFFHGTKVERHAVTPSDSKLRGAFVLPLPGSDSALLGLTGAISILFGIVMFVEPGAGVVAVLALIAAYALIVGLAELTLAIGGKRILRSFERRYMSATPEGSR